MLERCLKGSGVFIIIKLMRNKRRLKQFLYGAGYIIVIFGFIFLIYILWLKPSPTCFDNIQNQSETGIDCGGPCQPCELKNLVPIDASWVKYFPASNQTAIVAKINNTNIRWGADSFTYALDIYGTSSVKIKTITGNSFIYSGEIKYLFELSDIDSKNISDVKISFSDVSWKEDIEFPKPFLTQVRGVKTEASQGGGVNVSGFVLNNNAFNLSKLGIVGFLSNSSGIQISASRTELENIPAFTEVPFKINFPKNFSLLNSQTVTSSKKTASSASTFSQADPTKTEVYVEALR